MIKKTLKIIGAIFAFIIFLAIISPTPPKEDVAQNTVASTEAVVESEVPGEEVADSVPEETVSVKAEPRYTIIYTKPKLRSDQAAAYWVLVDPVDLSSDAFKSDVENVVRKLIVEEGTKISLSIFDDRSALDVNYKQYGDLSLGRVRTDEESKAQEQHFVATFDGDYQAFNFQYDDELTYFPGAIKSTPTVGQYKEMLEVQ